MRGDRRPRRRDAWDQPGRSAARSGGKRDRMGTAKPAPDCPDMHHRSPDRNHGRYLCITAARRAVIKNSPHRWLSLPRPRGQAPGPLLRWHLRAAHRRVRRSTTTTTGMTGTRCSARPTSARHGSMTPGTRLPRSCWNRASTSGSCSRSSVTPSSARPSATHTSPPRGCRRAAQRLWQAHLQAHPAHRWYTRLERRPGRTGVNRQVSADQR